MQSEPESAGVSPYENPFAARPYHLGMAQGSTGNVIAALASFFIPGLGQLVQGRVLAALVFFVLSGVLWLFLLGWLGHVVAALEAAVWKGKAAS